MSTFRQRGSSISEDAHPLVDSITSLITGGKRLRALLAWWGWQGAGGSADDPRIVDLGVALELFQAAALIHDDILDRSDTRRGKPSAHKAFETMHNENRWAQDGAHFGISAAILAGDLALGLSEEIFSRTADATPFSAPAREAFNTMRFEVMTGQYLDIHAEANIPDDPNIAIESARTVLRYKSAHYSAVWPFALGGVLAGADDSILDLYRQFSHPVGIAFQLGDDLLGVFGDPALTGKPSGDDLYEGKRTELIAHALNNLSFDDAQVVSNFLMHPAESTETIAQIQDLIEQSGARTIVESEISRLEDESRTALTALPFTESLRKNLQSFVAELLNRNN